MCVGGAGVWGAEEACAARKGGVGTMGCLMGVDGRDLQGGTYVHARTHTGMGSGWDTIKWVCLDGCPQTYFLYSPTVANNCFWWGGKHAYTH